MSKKSLSTLKLSAAVAILAAGVGVSGITSEAAFDAPYYNIKRSLGILIDHASEILALNFDK